MKNDQVRTIRAQQNVSAFETLRDMNYSLSSVKTLKNSALIPEVEHALLQWVNSKVKDQAPGVLIGALAMSFYTKPRATTDVDLLFLTQGDIPDEVIGFKRHRSGAFQENKTHVEVEVVLPATINVSSSIAKKVADTSILIEGLRVASLEGLIVLKLFGSDNVKRELKDLGDIVSMLDSQPSITINSLSEWSLSETHKAKLIDAIRRSRS